MFVANFVAASPVPAVAGQARLEPATANAPTDQIKKTLAALWSRQQLADEMNVSIPTFGRMESAGRIGPRRVELSRGCIRYLAAECRRWTEAGCPDRATWQEMEAAAKRRR
jgi:hypothetical protein